MMNADLMKDLSRCHAMLDAFVIDHYGNLLKIVDIAKEDGAANTHIEHLIDAFLQIGYDSGMQELNRRNPQCKIEDMSKP